VNFPILKLATQLRCVNLRVHKCFLDVLNLVANRSSSRLYSVSRLCQSALDADHPGRDHYLWVTLAQPVSPLSRPTKWQPSQRRRWG
jgi:hypothetical protein